MNVNLYLPDDLGRRAKDAALPLSQLLRQAVIEELQRRDVVAETLNEVKEHMLDVQDEDGHIYTGRFIGRELVYDDRRDVSVYLIEDGRVLVHDTDGKVWPLEDPARELRRWVRSSLYKKAMLALGIKPTIDL